MKYLTGYFDSVDIIYMTCYIFNAHQCSSFSSLNPPNISNIQMTPIPMKSLRYWRKLQQKDPSLFLQIMKHLIVVLLIHLGVSLLGVAQVHLQFAVLVGAEQANDLHTPQHVGQEHEGDRSMKPNPASWFVFERKHILLN